MLSTIKKYASLVRFSHTIFAMPFALSAFVYAFSSTGIAFDWLLLVKIILCMVTARNAAMGFNRYVDRKIDSLNPRTSSREIPAGIVTPRGAAIFVTINALLFILGAWLINPLTFYLSPVALLVILGYSLTKRSTWLCHIVLGTSLAIAPMGAYIAVTGSITIVPIIMSLLVLTWCAGFDIIYSLQDAEFDSSHNLHSIAQKFGIHKALIISILLHVATVIAVVILYFFVENIYYIIGASAFVALIIYQHSIVSSKNLSRINMAFGTTNGIASGVFGIFFILSMLLK